jgi:hypothetical protein
MSSEVDLTVSLDGLDPLTARISILAALRSAGVHAKVAR